MIMTCLGVCVLRVVWLFTAVPKRPEIKTVVFSYPLTWVITSILFLIYYRSKKAAKSESISASFDSFFSSDLFSISFVLTSSVLTSSVLIDIFLV